MILADTSIWIDHLRAGEPGLASLLNDNRVLTHPMVIGELACGNLPNRDCGAGPAWGRLPGIPAATDEEVLFFIEQRRVMGRGIGYIDAHLLAAATLARSVQLWTLETGGSWLRLATWDLPTSFHERGSFVPPPPRYRGRPKLAHLSGSDRPCRFVTGAPSDESGFAPLPRVDSTTWGWVPTPYRVRGRLCAGTTVVGCFHLFTYERVTGKRRGPAITRGPSVASRL